MPVAGDVEPVIDALRATEPELVFNLAESFDGKSALESNVAALLNLLGLRYTGSSPAGLLMAGDKSLTKKVLGFHEILTPQFATLYRGALDLGGRSALSADREAAAGGRVARHHVEERGARHQGAVRRRWTRCSASSSRRCSSRSSSKGASSTSACSATRTPQALPVIELDFSGFPADRPKIASWEAKWGEGGTGGERRRARSSRARSRSFRRISTPELASAMQAVAVEAFHALRLRDYARIDLRVSPTGEIYVIEVNPNCYLERDGRVRARGGGAAGSTHEALIARIIELALARYAR